MRNFHRCREDYWDTWNYSLFASSLQCNISCISIQFARWQHDCGRSLLSTIALLKIYDEVCGVTCRVQQERCRWRWWHWPCTRYTRTTHAGGTRRPRIDRWWQVPRSRRTCAATPGSGTWRCDTRSYSRSAARTRSLFGSRSWSRWCIVPECRRSPAIPGTGRRTCRACVVAAAQPVTSHYPQYLYQHQHHEEYSVSPKKSPYLYKRRHHPYRKTICVIFAIQLRRCPKFTPKFLCFETARFF